MAVTHDDVRHVATLARLQVDDTRLDHLVSELNGILAHMDALSEVDTREIEDADFAPTVSTPVRSDASGPLRMYSPLASFAPAVRDGFILVHRLASHEASVDSAP
jgi:aspartyl/glutamyl-tRNA(Asn/Gln) amidotransferase C subunit